MPLCPDCKDEAEITQHGPPTPLWAKLVQAVFGSDESASPDHERCSRCGQHCDECGSEF